MLLILKLHAPAITYALIIYKCSIGTLRCYLYDYYKMVAGIIFNFTQPDLIIFNSSEFSFTVEKHDIDEIIYDLFLLLICFVGILGNSVAVVILSESSSIRKSRPYTLLVNQSVMDILAALSGMLIVITKYTLKREGMRGIVDQFLCHAIHNHLGLVIHSCSSSYNLTALSVERMFSIVWPIRHRISFTPKNMKCAALAIWLFSVVSILSYSIGANGIAPNGRCYFWNPHPGTQGKVYVIMIDLLFSIIPFTAMLTCYIVMYYTIAKAHLKVKINIIRVLGTCVMLYFMCHIPRVVLSFISNYGNINWINKPIFNASIALLISNTMVNPIVYLIQYRDYNREFKKQLHRMLGRNIASVTPSQYSSSSQY